MSGHYTAKVTDQTWVIPISKSELTVGANSNSKSEVGPFESSGIGISESVLGGVRIVIGSYESGRIGIGTA